LLTIGLTGGIGSGKTVASDHFARLGAEVIDTDLLSRELVEPGQPALDEIVAHFGTGVLDAEGRLDRAALRARVFTDAVERRALEQILHPRIRAAMLERAAASKKPYVVFVIPLLMETGQQSLVDRVLLIDAPETLQRERAAARDGVDQAEIDRILAAQTDREARRRHADDIVVNDGDLAKLYEQIERLHRNYLNQIRS
jgi:dephospho-CoA kinase